MRKILAVMIMCFTVSAYGTEIVHKFKNPSFSGLGTGSHYLTIENQESSRKKAIKDSLEAAAKAAQRAEENTTLAKFIRNLESRIYATLSKQMVDAMFADCGDTCANSGSADVEGNNISWVKDPVTGTITLTVTGEDGTVTEITIPGMGEFNF